MLTETLPRVPGSDDDAAASDGDFYPSSDASKEATPEKGNKDAALLLN